MRLIGTGPGGQILMALGPGALRTAQLTTRIQDFSSRSVYRHVNKMEAHGLIDRSEERGVPSKVVLSLSEPAGRELFRLFQGFAATSMSLLPGGVINAHSWSSLNRLGELWEFGFFDELSHEARSLTELAGGPHGLTYHQVNRRTNLFLASGLLVISPVRAHGKRYELTDYARRRMALVAGIGRWRRHVTVDGAVGLTIAEMATVLRTVLPLPDFPLNVGMSIDLGVSGPMDVNGRRGKQTLQGTVDIEGTMRCDDGIRPSVEGSAAATINIWFAALLDGNRGRIGARGDLDLVDSFLTQLYDVLREKDGLPVPTA
ncbi:MAG TPA: winged helix-turn-helix transcriptional regulator [Solirubrobacterales bacterium]|nr:winged helix-turn-helix transcriptional regulator [Solirubrobacterales bacterium]